MNMNRYVQWKTNNPDSYEEVLRRRRERYRASDEYRERQLQHTAEWRKKQRKKQKAVKNLPKPKLFNVNGHAVECWSAGRVAYFLDVDKKTITNLEERGSIPTNHLVAPNRHRWWPAEFIRWIKPYFEQKSEISAEEFTRRVWIGWSEEQVRGVIPVISGGLLREESSDGGETSERSIDS